MLRLLKSFFRPKMPPTSAPVTEAPYKLEAPVAQESTPVAEPVKEVTSETASKPAPVRKTKAPARPRAEKKPVEKKPAKPRAKKAEK